MCGFFKRKANTDAEKLLVRPLQYSAEKLASTHKNLVKRHIQGKSWETGDTFKVKNLNGEFEVLKTIPGGRVYGISSTELELWNNLVWEPDYEKFEIEDERLIELEEDPGLEDKKQVSSAKSFARIIDQTEVMVERYLDSNTYVVAEYYYQF